MIFNVYILFKASSGVTVENKEIITKNAAKKNDQKVDHDRVTNERESQRGIEKDKIIYTMEDVMTFLEVLLLEWKLTALLYPRAPSSSSSLSSQLSGNNDNSKHIAKNRQQQSQEPQKQQQQRQNQNRSKAQDWFIEKSQPICLNDLGYWDKLFSLFDAAKLEDDDYNNQKCGQRQSSFLDESIKGLQELSINE